MKLYRFERNDPEGKRLQTIANGNIFISNPHSFNDLDDCSIDAISHIKYDTKTYEKINTCIEILYENNKNDTFPLPEKILLELKKYLSYCHLNETDILSAFRAFRDQPKIIEKIHNHIKQSTGVYCFFSGEPYHPLMWAHYADNHKGFCIEYDASEYKDGMMHKVNYSTSPMAISIKELLLCPNETLTRLLTTKSFEWNHEKEFRLIYLNELKNGEKGKEISHPQHIKPIKIITGDRFEHSEGIRALINRLEIDEICYKKFIARRLG